MKKKKRRSKKKKVVASFSCNTTSSLLGLVEHHDEEEIYSSPNDVNQVGSSGLKFIMRTGKRWGCPLANLNIIFRGELSYQIRELEVRGAQVRPPSGLYKNEEAGGMVLSFSEFLAAKEKDEVAPTPPKVQKKVNHEPVSPTVEAQAGSYANDRGKLKLDDVGAGERITKLLKKIPTRFSIWEILSFSEETIGAIITALHTQAQYEACLAEMQVEAVVANTESITFTPEDMLLPMTTHNMPLYMRGQLNGLPLNRILVDPGAIPEEIGDPLVPILGLSDMSHMVTRMAMRQQISFYQCLSQRETFRKMWYPPNMDRDLLKITPCLGLSFSLGGHYTVGMISIANQTKESSSGVVYYDYLEEGTEAEINTIANEESPLEVAVSSIRTSPESSVTQVLSEVEESTNDKAAQSAIANLEEIRDKTIMTDSSQDPNEEIQQAERFIWEALYRGKAVRGREHLKGMLSENVKLPITHPNVDLKPSANTLSVVAALLATVSCTAAFTVPGGYRNDGPQEGLAVLARKAAFKVFLVADAITVCASLTASYALNWALRGDDVLLRNVFGWCIILVYVSLVGVGVSFATGTFAVVSRVDLSLAITRGSPFSLALSRVRSSGAWLGFVCASSSPGGEGPPLRPCLHLTFRPRLFDFLLRRPAVRDVLPLFGDGFVSPQERFCSPSARLPLLVGEFLFPFGRRISDDYPEFRHWFLFRHLAVKLLFEEATKGSGRRHIGVKPRPLIQCQRPDMDANTNSGVQRYGRQLL
ncbi:hypothetical protein Taro_037641 [Colocasia esculenta]|uniref:PGG domain-containing protein n=1 Tax=Colocasia esculenta TaxID=4460 RepID=A0A843WLB7_COLES|nr:hypothetical protein [Colocasia esculenta]